MEREKTNRMIVGFAKHGKGDGHGVVGYITDGADAIEYVSGGKKAGKVRDPAPVVIRGEPKVARHVIDLTPFKWKYTSAMVSFSPGERITPEMERRIMDEFERCAFSGLSRERFYCLWVRHTDGPGKCHHLHVVSPRMDLLTGKSLNIAPPGKGSRELFDTMRSKLNAELGLSDPDDPTRIQTVRLPHHVAKAQAKERKSRGRSNEDARVLITRHLEEKAREGLIKNRDDVARSLRESGFAITREGNGYLTVQNQETGERVRLRGSLYDREQCSQLISRVCERGHDSHGKNPARLRELGEKLERLVAARAEHNLKRYGPNVAAPPSKEKFHDRPGERTVGGGARDGTLVQGAREETERAFDRFDRATENFVESSRLLDRAIERAKERQRKWELDQRLISKYGARDSASPPSVERGFDRELEREFV